MSGIGKVRKFTVDGVRYQAKGGWTINTGAPLREMIAGDDGVHGHTEVAQVPFFEGPLTVSNKIQVAKLQATSDATVVMETGDGKRYILRGAIWAGEGDINTDEGEIAARFAGLEMDIDE